MKKKSKSAKNEKILTRPPIVTIMGHVDHGKTTLLDAIRQTNVAQKEYGGITQHIGAYQVVVKTKEGDKKITFIDTPGHEAFEKMRSRGASITDIVVLVVDSTDGPMPQTRESIAHCQKSHVPFLIALTKTDLSTTNIEKVKGQLAEKEKLPLEGYGGDIVCVPVSAKTKKGLDELLEMILLLAEMTNIKADPEGKLDAVVIESKLDKFKGPLASIIVKNGTLSIGDEITIKDIKGKVKSLINDKGERIEKAIPGTPVEILGFEKVPPVGSKLERKTLEKVEKNLPIEEVARELKLPEIKEEKLNIVLKVDSTGSLEAIEQSLPENIEVILKNVGEVNESDILLARSSKAIVVGFNVRIPSYVQKLADSENILVRSYQIIYQLIEELEEAAQFVEIIEETEKILGKAKIIAKFPGGKYNIAGCKVLEGRIAKSDTIKIVRAEEEIGHGKISSMKHAKEEINKAEVDIECGIVFEPQIDFSIGDMLISYRKLF